MHIPKTGGTSIEQALLPWTEGKERPSKVLIKKNQRPWRGPPRLAHLTASEYLKYGWIQERDWNQLFRFTVVRNPWERLVSEYNWRGPSLSYRLQNRNEWSFREFVLHWFPRPWNDNFFRGFDSYRHVKPQSDFIFGANGEALVENVIVLENLAVEWPAICENIGFKSCPELPRKNPSRARDPMTGELVERKPTLQEYYDEDTDNAVQQYYAEDLRRFGFKRPF